MPAPTPARRPIGTVATPLEQALQHGPCAEAPGGPAAGTSRAAPRLQGPSRGRVEGARRRRSALSAWGRQRAPSGFVAGVVPCPGVVLELKTDPGGDAARNPCSGGSSTGASTVTLHVHHGLLLAFRQPELSAVGDGSVQPTVMVPASVARAPVPSVTMNVKWKVPACVGVPVSEKGAVVDKLIPGGSLPAAIDATYGPTPPNTAKFCK